MSLELDLVLEKLSGNIFIKKINSPTSYITLVSFPELLQNVLIDGETIPKYWGSTSPYSSFQIQTREVSVQSLDSAPPSLDVTEIVNEVVGATENDFSKAILSRTRLPLAHQQVLILEHWCVIIIFLFSYFNDLPLNKQICSLGKGQLDWLIRTRIKWED